MTNVIAVKGHLVTKSSALSTGNSKLESQFITAQNMASHYKRVINAKSAINTLPPKSLTCSQKARDRARREIKKYSSACQSLDRAKSSESVRNSMSMTDASEMNSKSSNKKPVSIYRDVINRRIIVEEITEPKTLPNQQKLNKSMSNLMSNFTKPTSGKSRVQASPRNSSMNETHMFAKSFMGDKTKNALGNLLFNTQNNTTGCQTSDFQQNPALKAMSRLVAGRPYDVLDNHAQKFSHPTKSFEPRIINSGKSSSIAQKSSCYQAPRRRKKRQSSTAASITNLHEKSIHSEHNEEDLINEEDLLDDEIPKNKSINRSLNRSLNNSVRRDSNESIIRKKKEEEKEQEIKYLEFIKQVTDDVIARGISSKRVINTCFDYHIEKNKHILNENKMNELLEKLKQDLGLKSDDVTGDSKYSTLDGLGQTIHASSRRTSKASLNNSKLSDYENQISKNIQSIRRNSLEQQQLDKENTKPDILNTSKASQKSNGTRKSSSESIHSQPRISILKKTTSNSPEMKYQPITTINKSDSDESDEDIFSNARKNSTNLNNSKNKMISNSKISDQDLFNDDYGNSDDESQEEGELKKTIKRQELPSDEEEDDDDDDFDSMLKTKTFSNNQTKLEQARSRGSFDGGEPDDKGFIARATTPCPVPRKPNTPYVQKSMSISSDDEY